MATPAAFGVPQYKSGREFTKYVTLQEDKPLIGRIIPPIKALAASGAWYQYHACHFGYKVPVVGGGDEGKLRFELFHCPLEMDFRTKIVKVACEECAKTAQVKDELAQLEALYKREKKKDEDIKELLAPKVGYLKAHNRDSKIYLNFEKEDGEIVVLMISNTTFKDLLKPLLSEIEEKYGFDPLLAGVVFEFSSTGKGLSKVDKVRYVTVMEEIKNSVGKTVKTETIKCVEWTEAAANNAAEKGIDLRNPDRFVRISQDQIKMLVNGSGDPEDNARIFALGSRLNAERSVERSPVRPIVNKPSQPTPAVSSDDADAEEMELLHKLAEAKARKAMAAAQKVATPPPASLVDGEGMSDEDFMAAIRRMDPA